MEGYDVVLLANFYAFPSFTERYGTATGDPKTHIRSPLHGKLAFLMVLGSEKSLVYSSTALSASERIQKDHDSISYRCHRIHFHPVLRQEPHRSTNWKDPLWYPVGCLPDLDHGLCFGSLSNAASCIPHHLRQSLLGHWPIDWIWSVEISGPKN